MQAATWLVLLAAKAVLQQGPLRSFEVISNMRDLDQCAQTSAGSLPVQIANRACGCMAVASIASMQHDSAGKKRCHASGSASQVQSHVQEGVVGCMSTQC